MIHLKGISLLIGFLVAAAGRPARAAGAFDEPRWPTPATPSHSRQELSVSSGRLALVHDGSAPQAFAVSVDGRTVAIGWDRSLVGYLEHGKPSWVTLDGSAHCTIAPAFGTVVETSSVRDSGGATWHLQRRYSASRPGAIEVETTITVDHERQVIFLPMLGLFPGAGSFGAHKTQAVFPGLEYLGDEPSSSEADVIGPASKRQVPDSMKITFPLMALAAQGRYVGLIWEPRPQFAAVFDSPDRLFGSGGHVMGLIFPGSNGSDRVEGSLLPRRGTLINAQKPLVLRATIIGGEGDDVTPALRQYVELRGLPALPPRPSLEQYVSLAAAGWLDSQIAAAGEYHHAIPGGFPAHPAADAAMFEDWLATQTTDAALRQRLTSASGQAIARVDPASLDLASVSHISYPVESLIYGHAAENADAAERHAYSLLERFQEDGSVRYVPAKLDLGKTNPSPEANGLTAALVAGVLRDASVCGDRKLTDKALGLLRAMDKFAGSVPRGAQTWEVPLHTPDILASAHLVRAYTLGYELSGDRHFLGQARYWAWTGVPFIYLTPPVKGIGLYGGIAVFGATQWRAPVWMGMPVQWCALVYADALYDLPPYDSSGPWKQLADGITISGIQQIWPKGADPRRQGLLPDSFVLATQVRNNPAINPGTLQADAVRLYSDVPLYDFHGFTRAGLFVHAPGRISSFDEQATRVSFTVASWLSRPYFILVSGLRQPPRVRLDGGDVNLSGPHQYIAAKGRLVLRVSGTARVEIDLR